MRKKKEDVLLWGIHPAVIALMWLSGSVICIVPVWLPHALCTH